MKKIIFGIMGVLALASCDPKEDKFDFNAPTYTENDLESCITFVQTDAEGNVTSDGNYFTYTTNPATTVSVFVYRADGSENILATGPKGSFTYAPARGEDTNQTIYVRGLNTDGSMPVAKKQVTVFVPSELEPAIRILASNDYGSKVWKWDPSVSGTVWGNMGYCGGSGAAVGTTGNGQWWGVSTNDSPDDGAGFNQQLQHSAGGVNHGDGDLAAYMVISESGLITCYDKDGGIIRQGAYKVENYDTSDPDAWKVGDLVTDAILWPWVINTNAKLPSETGWGTGAYEICYLTADKMTLVYPGEGAAGNLGGWGEATYWHFCSSSDFSGMIAGYDNGKDWTWDTSITGAVWGNMGYCGGSGADVGETGNGQWWGVTSTDEFNGQLQHTNTGSNIGDGDLNAYMTIGTDGLIKSYDAQGTVIRSGAYELTPIEGDNWKVADLKTDAILWPFEINSNGNIPGTYEVVYLTSDKMTLVYPDKGDFGGLGNWGEATFWHFKAK